MTRGTDVAQYTRCHVQAVTIELLGLLRPGVDVTQFRLGTRGGTETNKKERAGGEYIELLLITRGTGCQYIGRLVAPAILTPQLHALRSPRTLPLPRHPTARTFFQGDEIVKASSKAR